MPSNAGWSPSPSSRAGAAMLTAGRRHLNDLRAPMRHDATGSSHLAEPLDPFVDRRVRAEQPLHGSGLLTGESRGLVEPEMRGCVVRRAHRVWRVADLLERGDQARGIA